MSNFERPVLVTGATGNVGSAVVRELIARGLPARLAGTDLDRLQRAHPEVPAVRLDLNDPTTFAAALEGVGGLFLIRPPALASVGPTLNALIDAAATAGVGHVVYSSVAGAEGNRLLPHHAVERHLQASPLSWTILRPGFFAQNLADAYRADLCQDDRIYLPAGAGRVAFIDARDIGAAAAAVFADPPAHRGAGYLLTGPAALGFEEVADILTRELGRPISYQPATVLGYLRHTRGSGLPWGRVLVQAVLHTGLRRGQAQDVDDTLARLLGRAPRTLAEYVRDHRDVWTGAPGVAR